VFVIPREVEHGRADDYVDEFAGEWHLFDRANLKIIRRQSCRQRCRQLPHVIDTFGILIQCEYLASFPQQVDQVPAVTASGVEHAHARSNVPAQNLVENIDIDLPELLLDAQGHYGTFSIHRDGELLPV
jgi:hypothetical protein